ncbi:MAG TPA: hypothetical protein VJ813_04495 [Vicinamibacterales bacterium]|nr:hypothetical protein [Vicinamibacterales bacterium]
MKFFVLLYGLLAAGAMQSPQSPAPLSAAQLRAPCVPLVTVEEVRSLGRKEILTQVSHDHPGSSLCGWEGPGGSTFVVTLQNAKWFEYAGSAGAKESFDERRKAYDEVVGTDPVTGLGLEARITRHERLPVVMVRRAADVVYVMCDCSREQTIAIATLAVR